MGNEEYHKIMKTQYVIVEMNHNTGELRIGFQSCDKILLMADFIIFGVGKRQTKITNRFYSMSVAKRTIKRLEKHHERIRKLI